MTTKTDTQAAFEKWLGARADDPSLPHGLMRDAFCAGVEADRQGRMPSDEELLKVCESAGFLFHYDRYAPGSGHGLQAKAYTLENFRALLTRYGQPAASAEPSGYAYRYPDGIRFNDGREINGCKPTETLPYWFGAAPVAQEPVYQVQYNNEGWRDASASRYEAVGKAMAYSDASLWERRIVYAAPVAAQAQPVVNQQMTTDTALADTQRQIIEAAERRGYERAEAENVGYRTDAERYRWLKENIEIGYELPGGYYIPDEDTDTWDKTIDAARAAKEADHD